MSKIEADQYGFSSNPFYWVTKEGKIIAIEDLPNDHLLNILTFLDGWSKKRAEKINEPSGICSWGADDDSGSYEEEVCPEKLLQSIAPYKNLVAEKQKRLL